MPIKRGGEMAEVQIERRDDFEKMLRKFRFQCKKEGIIQSYKDRQYYIKPSQRKRHAGKKNKSF